MNAIYNNPNGTRPCFAIGDEFSRDEALRHLTFTHSCDYHDGLVDNKGGLGGLFCDEYPRDKERYEIVERAAGHGDACYILCCTDQNLPEFVCHYLAFDSGQR